MRLSYLLNRIWYWAKQIHVCFVFLRYFLQYRAYHQQLVGVWLLLVGDGLAPANIAFFFPLLLVFVSQFYSVFLFLRLFFFKFLCYLSLFLIELFIFFLLSFKRNRKFVLKIFCQSLSYLEVLGTAVNWLSCSTSWSLANHLSKTLSWMRYCDKIIKWMSVRRAKVDNIRVVHYSITFSFLSIDEASSLSLCWDTSESHRITVTSNVIDTSHVFILNNRLAVFWAVSVIY